MKRPVVILVIIIAVFAAFAASMGIFSSGGPGRTEFVSVHGETVILHGDGIYKNMSADVAPQGIAQDYVTLFIAVPLLLISLFLARGGSVRYRLLLAGVLGYFFVTYLFYLMMGMYNNLFLIYALLLCSGFFALSITMLQLNTEPLQNLFNKKAPVKASGGFLIFNAAAIALLWLGVVVPPLIKGITPPEVQHYTTLVVQGLDLGLLLPVAFVSGILIIKKHPSGYLLVPVYYIFLSLLMTALTAKIIAMWMLGVNVIPAVFIIPVFNITAIFFSVALLKNIKQDKTKP
jgi:hypothetical protein